MGSTRHYATSGKSPEWHRRLVDAFNASGKTLREACAESDLCTSTLGPLLRGEPRYISERVRECILRYFGIEIPADFHPATLLNLEHERDPFVVRCAGKRIPFGRASTVPDELTLAIVRADRRDPWVEIAELNLEWYYARQCRVLVAIWRGEGGQPDASVRGTIEIKEGRIRWVPKD